MVGQQQCLLCKTTLKNVWNSPCLPQAKYVILHWRIRYMVHRIWNVSISLCLIYFLQEPSDILCMLPVSACTAYSYIWKKRITASILNENNHLKKCHQVWLFWKLWLFSCCDTKLAKKRVVILNFLVFGAAKSMNSHNLFQGRWYRETTHTACIWFWMA